MAKLVRTGAGQGVGRADGTAVAAFNKTTEYTMDSGSSLGHEQLRYLEALLDPPTTRFLDDVGVSPGARCLDLGSGAGSIARVLSERAGRTGRTVAIDIDTEQLDVPSWVEVHRHDINGGLPVDGPFDLIHARFVLMHLSKREQILQSLLDALAPGGWLVLGESPVRPQEVLSAPSQDDADLADRVIDSGMRVTHQAGVSWEWAYQVERHLAAAGLEDIRGNEYSRIVTGGDAGTLLCANYVKQTRALLLDDGRTEQELARFDTLMHDSRFRAWPFFRLVMTAGRKPMP